MIRRFAFGPLAALLVLTGCSSTPKPTGDHLTSISWVNSTPYPMTLVTTRVCGRENTFTLDELPPYSESAQRVKVDLTRNCTVGIELLIGKSQIPKQVSWIPEPRVTAKDRNYHLRIQVYPTQPPGLTLESPDTARKRLEAAGREIGEE